MKYFLLILTCLLVACGRTNIEHNKIYDAGKKQIGNNLYLKKMYVGRDRVYILINEKDEIISGLTSTSYTVYSENKNSSVKTKSNTYIY